MDAAPASAGQFDRLLADGHAALDTGRLPQAVQLLQRAVQTAPGHAGAQHLLGIALDQAGRTDAALAVLLRALQLAPQRIEAAQHAAGIFLRRADRVAAARVLLTAAAAAQTTVPAAAHLCRARGLGILDRHAEAAGELRAVLAHRPHDPEAWRLLGNSLAATGDIAAAQAALRRAVALAPHDASALLDLVRAARVAEADRPLIARIEAELAAEQQSARRQMLLWFALGKAHDDLHEPAQAMRAFDAGNALRAQTIPFDAAGWSSGVDAMIAALPHPLPFRAEASRAVCIVGMPRSGTTLVEQILSSHPDVAAGGEMPFWGVHGGAWLHAAHAAAAPDAVPASLQDTQMQMLRTAHARALAGVSTATARVTDKNPFNFAWLGLIRRALPGAYIIHCRRDPRDTCLSAYMTLFSGGNGWAATRAGLAHYYREYQRLMQHWRATLPPERFIEIDYEAVAAAPEAAARQLVAFCDLPWDDACLRPEANARPVHTASVYQAREAVHRRSVEKWRRYEPWLGELRDLR